MAPKNPKTWPFFFLKGEKGVFQIPFIFVRPVGTRVVLIMFSTKAYLKAIIHSILISLFTIRIYHPSLYTIRNLFRIPKWATPLVQCMLGLAHQQLYHAQITNSKSNYLAPNIKIRNKTKIHLLPSGFAFISPTKVVALEVICISYSYLFILWYDIMLSKSNCLHWLSKSITIYHVL